MTRLSTGLRINSGKDDPAGLIASELLKSDMTATSKAITNTQRANSMVGIADAALGQISGLLNDIRGLVNEAASTGTMTYEQIYANQLQVNAALDSIDRIAKTANYLGKNLLDGSLDFQTRGLDRTAIRDLKIFEANFGTGSQVDIGINVLQDATHGQLYYDKAGVSTNTVIEVAGNDGSNLISIAAGSTVDDIAAAINLSSDSTGVRAVVGRDATAGQIFLTSAGLDNDINLTALMAGAAAGNFTIKFSASDTDQSYYTLTEPQNGKPGIIDFKLKMQPNAAPGVDKFDESFNGLLTYDISGNSPPGTATIVPAQAGKIIAEIGGVGFTFTTMPPGDHGGITIEFDDNVAVSSWSGTTLTLGVLDYTALDNGGSATGFANYLQGLINSATGAKPPGVSTVTVAAGTGTWTAPADETVVGAVADVVIPTGTDAVMETAPDINIVVQTTNGQQIRHIEFVQSASLNSSIPGGVAATFNKVTGKLQILYDASGNATEDALRKAINAIDGFEYMGIYDPSSDTKIPSINVAEIGATGMFINHTDANLPTGTVITFVDSALIDSAVSVDTSVANAITVTLGANATYDDIIAALNASGSWAVSGTGVRPVPNSFKLVDAGGQPIKGTTVALSAAGGLISPVDTAVLGDVVVPASPQVALTEIGSDIFLRTTEPGWNGLTFEIALTGAASTGIVVDFNGADIVVTVGSDIAPFTTYDDILAALKNTSAWTGMGSRPSTVGLWLTDSKGAPATGTNVPVQTLAPITLNDVIVSDATKALRDWLLVDGSGTKSAKDMRANNALNITAAVTGTKFENTDVVYVKAEGQIFSESFRLGYQNIYLASDDKTIPPPMKGVTVEFRDAGAGNPTIATLSGSTLKVNIADGDSIDAVLAAIWGATGDGTFRFVDPTQAPVNGNQSAKSLIGKTLNLDNVQMDYRDTPTPAAATITLNTGNKNLAGDDIIVQMRIVADRIGTEFNDVMIEFEQDNNFKPGDVSVVYDEVRKILHIRGQIDGPEAATYGAVKAAIEKASPFHVDVTTTHDNKPYPLSNKLHSGLSSAASPAITGLSENSPKGSAYIKTGQYVGDVGGNNQTLYITVATDATANDVVDAFRNAKGTSAQIAANFIVSNAIDNNGSGKIFSSTLDRDINVRVFASALTGGNDGIKTDVTAKELVDLINNDAVLSKLFRADIARGQIGNGFLTLFDEAAYYGSTIDDNALQFLGPKGSPDVLFVIDGPNSQLGLSFVDNYGSGCISDDRPIASLNAWNANAAFSVQALTGGSEYDDMLVRLIRLNNNHTVADSYASYKSGPSNAMAYCSINNDQTIDGTSEEKGKFIIYANLNGEQYNNVDVVVKLDVNQTAPAAAYYDTVTKRLIVTVNNGDTTLSEAVAAINNEGTFRADYDYSFNTDPTDGTLSDGPGLETFAKLLSATGTVETTIGNTGNTGGHAGGVLEVYVGGKADEITAEVVINTINNGPTVKSLFAATAIGGTDAGKGVIHFRNDNIRQVLGSDGKMRNEVNMVTGILGSDENAQGYMVIHLASDANGNSITTARDLVKFFDQLTPEQTRGISVSVIRPPGVDNLDRKWTYDSCGNIIETQLCDDQYGLGILKPTYEIDDCGNVTYFPIEFFSYGQDIRPGNAYGSVIAQNGLHASLDIRSKVQGPDFNGVGFKYVKLGDPTAQMYAEYDGYSKMITVYIHDGTTAGQVKGIIESSEQTRNIFEVSLPGNGSGVVSLQDDYLLLKGGLFDAGYRGGAAMQGAADADAHRLVLESLGEGSRQYVSVRWIDGGDFRVTDVNGFTSDTSYGTDMIATINGMSAKADGRELTLASAMLKLGIILDTKVTTGDRLEFTITGGGAVVQMGPNVVSNQQIRFGLQSMSSASLGGGSGKLYQLREGENADLLTSDASRKLADRIVQEAILAVARTRGRIGAIQKNTLEPQINALQDSLVAISAAEAQISNADFAEESSRLTRAQILVQAGTRTLSIANQFPQYAASLLGG